MAKICVICGLDVANLPRTKDQNGNYYCQPCAERARQSVQTAAPQESLADLTRGAANPNWEGVSTEPTEQDIEIARADIEKDVGPYVRVANSFSLRDSNYAGAALLSPRVIYFIKERTLTKGANPFTDENTATIATGVYLGGVVGGVVALGIVAASSNSPADIGALHTCSLRDLARTTRSTLDPQRRALDLGVVVANKRTVSYIYDRRDGIALLVGKDPMVLHCGEAIGQVAELLEKFGWRFKVQMRPTAIPAYNIGQSTATSAGDALSDLASQLGPSPVRPTPKRR